MVGRHVLMHARALEHEIYAPTRADLDLRNVHQISTYLEDLNLDTVVHCAGLVGGIEANIRKPLDFFIENLDIGRNVVFASRSAGVKHLINLGSSCMYPHDASNPLKESDLGSGRLEPTNEAYAMAKLAVCSLCRYINRQENKSQFKYITLIPSNLYGPYDCFDPIRSHLVPAVIHKLHVAKTNGRSVVDIWGNGEARREFMYASDVADGIWFAINHLNVIPELLNIGLGRDFTVREIYEVAARVLGYEGMFSYDKTKPVGMQQKLMDSSRIFELGWAPKVSLDQGILKTYEYYLGL